jgi:hypothetical protein
MLPETNAIITAYALLLLWASSSKLVLAHYVRQIGPDGAHKLFKVVLDAINDCSKFIGFPAMGHTGVNADSLPTTPRNLPHFNCNSNTQGISPPFVLALSMVAMKGTNPPSRLMASDSNINDTRPLQPDKGNSKPVATPVDSSQPAAIPPLTHHVHIGNRFFPAAPSLPVWRMTIDLHLTFKPIANHVTMVLQLKLAKEITWSKCVNASKLLSVKCSIVHHALSQPKSLPPSRAGNANTSAP